MDRSRTSAGMLATLAGLVGAAGLVHLAVVPAHVAEWPGEGRAFAVLAVAQLGLAVLLVARPSREALALVVPVQAVAVAGWAWSRTSGLPFGPNPDVAEDVGWLDGLTTGAEVLAVLVAVGLLVATRRDAVPPVDAERIRLSRPVRVGPPPAWGVGLAAVLVAGSIGLAASPAGQHSHGAEGGHSHGGPGAGEPQLAAPLDLATADALGAELTEARQVALRYPTVADARDAGLLQAGEFIPGSAAHYVDIAQGMATEFDIEKPLAWLYSGTEPDSRLVGIMYYLVTDDPGAQPTGFTGPLDTWHVHSGACYRIEGDGTIHVPFSPDAGVERSACEAVEGAEFIEQTGWMVHAWVVPGWDSPLGVFSHDNPNILCADGRAQVADMAAGCVGT